MNFARFFATAIVRSRSLDQTLEYFLSFSFTYAFCYSPALGNLPCVKICFPQYFGITRRYMQKKNLGNFYFFTKKAGFCTCFRNGQRSVTEPGPTPSPWSILFLSTPSAFHPLRGYPGRYFGITKRNIEKINHFFNYIFKNA